MSCTLRARAPIADVFRFFEQPRNLARITPPWLRFVIRTPGPIDMRAGLTIDYTIRWLGIPMGWTSLITEYAPPASFTDEQVRGPYRLWHHRHAFVPDGDGTIISDHVRYSLPFGPLGRIAQALLVKHQLLGIFRYRQRAVARMLNVECTGIEEPAIRRLG